MCWRNVPMIQAKGPSSCQAMTKRKMRSLCTLVFEYGFPVVIKSRPNHARIIFAAQDLQLARVSLPCFIFFPEPCKQSSFKITYRLRRIITNGSSDHQTNRSGHFSVPDSVPAVMSRKQQWRRHECKGDYSWWWSIYLGVVVSHVSLSQFTICVCGGGLQINNI